MDVGLETKPSLKFTDASGQPIRRNPELCTIDVGRVTVRGERCKIQLVEHVEEVEPQIDSAAFIPQTELLSDRKIRCEVLRSKHGIATDSRSLAQRRGVEWEIRSKFRIASRGDTAVPTDKATRIRSSVEKIVIGITHAGSTAESRRSRVAKIPAACRSALQTTSGAWRPRVAGVVGDDRTHLPATQDLTFPRTLVRVKRKVPDRT